MEFRTTVIVEVYRVCCPDCGVKMEKVPQLPSTAPFSKHPLGGYIKICVNVLRIQ
jgi:uncharacterized metal-binding protein